MALVDSLLTSNKGDRREETMEVLIFNRRKGIDLGLWNTCIWHYMSVVWPIFSQYKLID